MLEVVLQATCWFSVTAVFVITFVVTAIHNTSVIFQIIIYKIIFQKYLAKGGLVRKFLCLRQSCKQLAGFEGFLFLICHSSVCNYFCSDCYSLYFGYLLDFYIQNDIPEVFSQSRFGLKGLVLEVVLHATCWF